MASSNPRVFELLEEILNSGRTPKKYAPIALSCLARSGAAGMPFVLSMRKSQHCFPIWTHNGIPTAFAH